MAIGYWLLAVGSYPSGMPRLRVPVFCSDCLSDGWRADFHYESGHKTVWVWVANFVVLGHCESALPARIKHRGVACVV